MDKIKTIKTLCIASLCTGTLCSQVGNPLENLITQTAPEQVALQQKEQISAPQDLPIAEIEPQITAEPIAPPAIETKAQEVEPKIPSAESAAMAPAAAPITRVIAPGQGATGLTEKKAATPSINDQPSRSLPTRQQEDTQALQDLAARSQDAKKHMRVAPPDDSDERIEFQFENTDLQKVIQQVGYLFNVIFITDDIITPTPQGMGTAGSKVTFRTQKPLTKKEAWNLFINFLDVAGFNIAPEKSPRRYRIFAVPTSNPLQLKVAVPSYIGVDPATLPDNDQMIRFVYFVENGNMAVIQNVVDKLRSSSSALLTLNDAKAFILTDKAYNIKTLMVIIKELDRVSMPQSMSVMKLYRADAKDVKDLFDKLMGNDDKQPQPMFMPPRQQPTALYFPPNTRLIAESRTNSLIILGTVDAIEKIESFIRKYVDKDPETPHSPLFYYDLKFADADTVKKILEETVGKFGHEPDTEAGKVGGIRGIDKYVRPMAFIADPATNRIIMKGDYQDYVMVKDLIFQIDQPQPQVAIEVLILLVSWSKIKQLGTQIRNYMKDCGGFGSERVQFQTSGLNGNSGIVEQQRPTSSTSNTIPNRLMGNLLDLVNGLSAGNTIITLGRDLYGVWGILQLLETFAAAETVANPFLLASNKQKAVVEVGEIRRVITSEIVQNASQTTPTFDDMKATLKVEVTPQINSDGMITLDIFVSLVNFLVGATATNVAQQTREITTKAIVSDREVLALGGLIQNASTTNLAKVPLLGDVPILGWLFKNENKNDQRNCLLILFSTQIIDPLNPVAAARFTQHHVDDYYGTLDSMKVASEKHDPIYRMFFEEDKKSVSNRVQNFIFEKPKKRTKKAIAQTEELKKEHPALADQPELLENIVSNKEKREEKTLLKNQIQVQAQEPMKVATNHNHGKRRSKVSLTNDAIDNPGMAA